MTLSAGDVFFVVICFILSQNCTIPTDSIVLICANCRLAQNSVGNKPVSVSCRSERAHLRVARPRRGGSAGARHAHRRRHRSAAHLRRDGAPRRPAHPLARLLDGRRPSRLAARAARDGRVGRGRAVPAGRQHGGAQRARKLHGDARTAARHSRQGSASRFLACKRTQE